MKPDLHTADIKTLLFADDYVIRAYLEDNKQRGVFTLQSTVKNFWNGHITRKIRQWHF
jgi:hypothetical protein